jgi:iron complex outermembrane receptor protein
MFKPQFQKRQVMVFHQFQRKGYSLFAALGREVVISVLSVATLSASKAASISDETFRVDSAKATAREVTLDDVCVTGSRAPLTVSQAARMVTVLSREDIAQAPVQSVNDLLKMAVGVDVRQRGPLGSQTDISIRGGTQEQIVVLLNGINICDPQTGHNTFDLPCDLSDIVRVEVLEGPAGRVYGTSSLVGAINIVTSSSKDSGKSAEFSLEGGSFGYAKVGVAGSYVPSQVPLTSRLSCSYARSDGYSRSRAGRLNTDFSGSKAFYQGAYDDAQMKLSWHVGLSDKGWG